MPVLTSQLSGLASTIVGLAFLLTSSWLAVIATTARVLSETWSIHPAGQASSRKPVAAATFSSGSGSVFWTV